MPEQLAHELKCEVCALTAKMPAKQHRDFCQDIRVGAIGSGEHRGRFRARNPSRLRALPVNRASAIETDNHLQDVLDGRYISQSEHERLSSLATRALIATTRLQSYLLSSPDKRRGQRGRS